MLLGNERQVFALKHIRDNTI